MSASHNITSGVPRTSSDKPAHDTGGFSIAKLPRILRGLGAAILIATSQMKHILGIDAHGHTLPQVLFTLNENMNDANPITIAIGRYQQIKAFRLGPLPGQRDVFSTHGLGIHRHKRLGITAADDIRTQAAKEPKPA